MMKTSFALIIPWAGN